MYTVSLECLQTFLILLSKPIYIPDTLIMFYKERSVLATPWQISYFLGRSLAVP